MSTLLKALASMIVICIIAAAGALWYIQPEQKLDLIYSELPLRDKLAAMAVSRKLEVTLTGPEVNQLLKKALAARPNITPDVAITGAQFALQGERLVSDVNLQIRGQLEAAATLDFELSWQEPYLTANHTHTALKRVSIPPAWFRLEPLKVNLNDYLPRLVAVKGLSFDGSDVKLSFKLR